MSWHYCIEYTNKIFTLANNMLWSVLNRVYFIVLVICLLSYRCHIFILVVISCDVINVIENIVFQNPK